MTVWRRRRDVLTRRSLDSVLLLPSGVTEPITLTGTGPEVWDLLAEPRSETELSATLGAAYRADDATVLADVLPVLEYLAEIGAVDGRDR